MVSKTGQGLVSVLVPSFGPEKVFFPPVSCMSLKSEAVVRVHSSPEEGARAAEVCTSDADSFNQPP